VRENGTLDLELIAEAFEAISNKISCEGLARGLLEIALEYSRAVRGAVLLSEGGELHWRGD
jgi:hypothetical protein